MAKSLRQQIELEIDAKIAKERELQRKLKEHAEDARDYAKRIATTDMDSGYATGEYVESIRVEQQRDPKGRFKKGWKVVSRDDKANLLEYGTKRDAPGGHATWVDLDGVRRFGPNTPTPRFEIFAKTAFRFGGTPDGEE